MTPAGAPLLEVRQLVTRFSTDEGELRAVDNVSFTISPGHSVGLVGESGSGKSVTALSILGLVRDPPGRIVGGEILFRGRDLRRLSDSQLRQVRGAEIAMIFQEPMTSLNPVMNTGDQVAESLILHKRMAKAAARAEAVALVRKVGIADPEPRVHDYPHQVSGRRPERGAIACRRDVASPIAARGCKIAVAPRPPSCAPSPPIAWCVATFRSRDRRERARHRREPDQAVRRAPRHLHPRQGPYPRRRRCQ